MGPEAGSTALEQPQNSPCCGMVRGAEDCVCRFVAKPQATHRPLAAGRQDRAFPGSAGL